MRLFFAYWPSASKASEIVPWVSNAHALFGGRMMRTDTLHMTLAFLGQADGIATQRLVEACRNWTLPTGDSMVLSEPGRFRNAKVVWVGPAATGTPQLAWLFQAHERLWSYLAPLGWQSQDATYRPHVSLLRNAGPGEISDLKGPEVPWQPDRCVLVGSRPTEKGSRYTVLAEIGLTKLGSDPTFLETGV